MKVYISGPITGLPREDVERAFAEAEAMIRSRGDIPISPLQNRLHESATWLEHMRADLRQLLECDAIQMIGKWTESKGAMLELDLSRVLKIWPYERYNTEQLRQIHYQKIFAASLRNGVKIHTIRHYPVEPGTKLKHVIYPYDRERREIVLENTCKLCQRVEIWCREDGEMDILVEGKQLQESEKALLLANDGIKDQDCTRYFGKAFSGYIIHWTDTRY